MSAAPPGAPCLSLSDASKEGRSSSCTSYSGTAFAVNDASPGDSQSAEVESWGGGGSIRVTQSRHSSAKTHFGRDNARFGLGGPGRLPFSPETLVAEAES